MSTKSSRAAERLKITRRAWYRPAIGALRAMRSALAAEAEPLRAAVRNKTGRLQGLEDRAEASGSAAHAKTHYELEAAERRLLDVERNYGRAIHDTATIVGAMLKIPVDDLLAAVDTDADAAADPPSPEDEATSEA